MIRGGSRAVRVAAPMLALLGAAFAPSALAVGLGEPVLRSAPGAPLDVSIPVQCAAGECEHFDAGLGGSADYRAAGVPEPRLGGGQISFAYDRAIEAIRVRTTTPLPPQTLHLLVDLRAGSTSLSKDVVVSVQSPAQADTAPQAAAAAPAPPPPVQAAPPPPAARIPAASAPAAKPAPPPAAPAHADKPADAGGAQLLGLLRSLDPAQVAVGLGIGAGLLGAYLVWRFLRAVYREVFGRWIGGLRYRLAERQRQRRHEAAAAQMPRVEPLAGKPRPGASPGGGPKTPELRDVKDDLARRLRARIEAEPQRLDLKLKLAERLFELKDGEAYTDLVLALKPQLKETAWERLRKLGQQLRPYDDRFLNLSDRDDSNVVPLMKSNY